MKQVELRRHSQRGPSGGLTGKGEALARQIHRRGGVDYDAYYSSPAQRAKETASAFGGRKVRVDARLALVSGAVFAPYKESIRAVMESRGIGILAAYFALPELLPILRTKGEEVLQAVREIAGSLPDAGCALAISHGSTIEPAALIALGGEMDLGRIGGEFGFCEGIRLGLDGDGEASVEVIRL